MEFKVLTDILDNLPEMDINSKMFKPTFDYGSHADLLKFIRMKNTGSAKNIYPLIWLVTPTEFVRNANWEKGELTFIIATISNAELSNRERTNVTFATTLNPLMKIVLDSLNAYYGVTVEKNAVYIKKFFKYDDDNSNNNTDIWDAIRLKFNINLNLDCLINK